MKPPKLSIVIPLVVGLVLASIFVPARQVNIKGLGTLSIGSETAWQEKLIAATDNPRAA